MKKHVVAKIENIFKEWQKLNKNKENKAKRTEGIKQKEEEWRMKLEDLFDIAHADALNMIRIQEDKQFLIAQREKGRRKMGGLDKTLAKREAETEKRKDRVKKLVEREKREERERRPILLLSSSTSEDDINVSDLSPVQDPSTSEAPPTKRDRKKLLDSDLAVSLDVAKLSDRKAAVVLTTTFQSVGCDLPNNTSSIRRQRIKFRQKIAESLKSAFKPEVPLTIHWDGKMIEDISGHETVDRLPILVS